MSSSKCFYSILNECLIKKIKKVDKEYDRKTWTIFIFINMFLHFLIKSFTDM